MVTDSPGSQQLLKDINRMALVRQVCLQPGLSRADLADTVGLTKSTVSQLTRELIAEGWLEEREIVATGDLGRRPTPLFVDPKRLLLLGAEIGVDDTRVVVTSLTGEVLARTVSVHRAGVRPEACLQALAQALLKLAGQFKPDAHRIIGLGLGLPGGVDEAEGVLRFAPNMAWRDVPVAALLAQRLSGTPLAQVPLFLQNEADVAALGELEFNTAEADDPLLYLSINQGVGAGVVVSDRLLTGRRGFAGEVGHMVLQVDGPLCSCGRRGCAEALITARAMLGRRGAGAEAAPLADGSLAEVQQRLALKHAPTAKAVRHAGAYLGVLLQNLAAAYDPGCIVLGGSLVALGEPFLAPALQNLKDYAAEADLPAPLVRTARFGADAVAVGAAALVRYRLTRPQLAPVVVASRLGVHA